MQLNRKWNVSAKFLLIVLICMATGAYADLKQTKPAAELEGDKFTVTWEVNGEPLVTDYVSVYDFSSQRYLNECNFKGQQESFNTKSGEKVKLGMNGISYECQINSVDPKLALTYMNLHDDDTGHFVTHTLYYPGDFESISHIDVNNIAVEDWLLSTLMEKTFFRGAGLEYYYSSLSEEKSSSKSIQNVDSNNQSVLENIKSELSRDLDSQERQHLYRTLYKLMIKNDSEASILYYTDFLSHFDAPKPKEFFYMAASNGCNTAKLYFSFYYPNEEFTSKYLNVDEALYPIDYGHLEDGILSNIDSWRAKWLAISKKMPGTVAGLRAVQIDEFVQSQFGVTPMNASERVRIMNHKDYGEWTNYLESLDFSDDYIGCEIFPYLLREAS